MAEETEHSTVSVANISSDASTISRYLQKLVDINGVDPYTLHKQQWSSDLSRLPEITFADITVYLVTTTSFYTGTQFKAFKGLAAYNQAYNGWVKDVKWYRPPAADCQQVVVTGKVSHSQKLSEKPLNPWVIIKDDGSVTSAHCMCMAGTAEACTHVAALLFFMDITVRLTEKKTVTGEAAYWAVPSGLKNAGPAKASEITFTNSKTQRKQDIQNLSTKSPVTRKRPLIWSDDQRLNFLEDLNSLTPKSGILSVLPHYQDSFLPASCPLPTPLLTYRNDNLVGKPLDNVIEHCQKIDLSLTAGEIKSVEQETRVQSKSKLWFRQREGRVTASEFFNVCRTKVEDPSVSLVQRIISRAPLKCESLQWGKTMENVARDKYIQYGNSCHKNFNYQSNGLFLCQEHPFLAATPDGMITCDCCGRGCLEIKCPYSVKNLTIEKAIDRKKFCLEIVNGKPSLRTEHPYFYQCQLQMFVTSTTYVDFCVWTNVDFFIQRIVYDNTFCASRVAKAKTFFYKVLLPEIVSQHFTISKSKSNAQLLYCKCNQHAFGEMILCDNKSCSYKWFHFPCVCISRAPKGKWFCDTCQKAI